MSNIVKPLAVSAHITCAPGEVFCFSLHNKVINLTDNNNQIITLHSFNNGLSPMGWSLRQDDFWYIYDLIERDHVAISQTNCGDLVFGDTTLCRQARQLNLTIQQPFTLQKNVVYTLLSPLKHSTGLFGDLASLLNQPLNAELQQFYEQISRFLTNQPFNLEPFIGLGPGLTPTFDDILVGIFAALYTDRSRHPQLVNMHTYLPESKLETLTTKVSAAFLTCAFKGTFTLNLLAVISSIRQYNQNTLAMKKLLSYGHSSGADLLLGIWIGTLLLEQDYHHNEVE
ncbi:DUF2877 domain-containing protein [Orbus sasakiae]|uniref:DUF2877 domain-containing protein n=1 Tax=Orbus sasakiae TaxID=1078475 RepID=A0ABP9ND46_9GAMM